MNFAKRFWSKVNKTDHCWEWTASLSRTGYGTFTVTDRDTGLSGRSRYKSKLAHRVSWEIEYGPVPDGMCICHRCDNPRCVRPDHLFVGDNLANMADKKAKGRGRGDFRFRRPPSGERAGSAKLTNTEAAEIRDLYASGLFKQSEIAAAYGVTTTRISFIVNNKSYKAAGDGIEPPTCALTVRHSAD